MEGSWKNGQFVLDSTRDDREQLLREALGTALRQWKSYSSDRNSCDLETAKNIEGDLYRRCLAIAMRDA